MEFLPTGISTVFKAAQHLPLRVGKRNEGDAELAKGHKRPKLRKF